MEIVYSPIGRTMASFCWFLQQLLEPLTLRKKSHIF